MRVAELMNGDVKTITPEDSIADLVQSLADAHVSGLPVVTEGGRVIGVVSATDVLRAAAEQVDEEERTNLFERMTVRDIMSSNPHVIDPESDVREAAKHMLYTEVRRLFVQDGDRLVGVISQTDIARAVGSGRLQT